MAQVAARKKLGKPPRVRTPTQADSSKRAKEVSRICDCQGLPETEAFCISKTGSTQPSSQRPELPLRNYLETGERFELSVAGPADSTVLTLGSLNEYLSRQYNARTPSFQPIFLPSS